jgi:hypothetical protein
MLGSKPTLLSAGRAFDVLRVTNARDAIGRAEQVYDEYVQLHSENAADPFIVSSIISGSLPATHLSPP